MAARVLALVRSVATKIDAVILMGDLIDRFHIRALAAAEQWVCDFWTVARQLFSAMEYLHGHNVAHQDIKLDNIMFVRVYPTMSFTSKLIDLGFSCMTRADDADDSQEDLLCDAKFTAPKALDVLKLANVLLTILTGSSDTAAVERLKGEFKTFIQRALSEDATARELCDLARSRENVAAESLPPVAVLPSPLQFNQLADAMAEMDKLVHAQNEALTADDLDEAERIMQAMLADVAEMQAVKH